MELLDVENDRILKVKSLLTDTISSEVELLNRDLDLIDLSKEQRTEIDYLIKFALEQDYGDHILYKYYVAHPLRVARLCISWQLKAGESHYDMIKASVIHNALEKNIISKEELRGSHGKWCFDVIDMLTVDRDKQKNDPTWEKQYYGQLGEMDKFGQLLKAFDKLDNIYALFLNSDREVRENYMREIEAYIKPIIETHASFFKHYFDELIASTKIIEHKSIETTLNELDL